MGQDKAKSGPKNTVTHEIKIRKIRETCPFYGHETGTEILEKILT